MCLACPSVCPSVCLPANCGFSIHFAYELTAKMGQTDGQWGLLGRDVNEAREEWGRGQMLYGWGRGQKKIVRPRPDTTRPRPEINSSTSAILA